MFFFLLLLYLIIRVRHRYPDRIYKEIGNVRCWHKADLQKHCKVSYERYATLLTAFYVKQRGAVTASQPVISTCRTVCSSVHIVGRTQHRALPFQRRAGF